MCLFGCRLNKSNRAISTICTNLFIDKGKSANLDQYKLGLVTVIEWLILSDWYLVITTRLLLLGYCYLVIAIGLLLKLKQMQ